MSTNAVLLCRCGCGREATVLASGQDYDGSWFTDEPMCESAANYVSEAAYLSSLPLKMQPLESAR